MGETIYALCALTSIACVVLLGRAYVADRTRLLLWASCGFALLALNNILLFTDLVLVPSVDLSALRHLVALGAIVVLLIGLVWETR